MSGPFFVWYPEPRPAAFCYLGETFIDLYENTCPLAYWNPFPREFVLQTRKTGWGIQSP